jgi:GntR family transcriptional regulator of vanillate catabolism
MPSAGWRVSSHLSPHSCRWPFLALEHAEVAQMNMRLALERRAESEQVMPAIRLVVG